MNRTEIYLSKRNKVLVPDKGNSNSKLLAATIGQNIQSLGYAFSPNLYKRLCTLTEKQIRDFYVDFLPELKKLRGAHVRYCPMYPNFPAQVMEMSQFELYQNAMMHYWTFWMKDLGLTNETWLPDYKKDERLPLTEITPKLEMIDLGSLEDFNSILTALIGAKTSISPTDKEIVEWFIANKVPVITLLPEKITMKENIGLLAGLLLKYNGSAKVMDKYIKTPTDVLRVAVALSGGDVSLAENTKFINFSRPLRRWFMGLLEVCKTELAEEMTKYRGQWVRLGERLHPGEYANKYFRVVEAFKDIRSDKTITTFNSWVEQLMIRGDMETAADFVATRPGEFARRLDHIFRSCNDKSLDTAVTVSKMFLDVADKVSTPVLLQLHSHFLHRNDGGFRSAFPKGNTAKIHVIEGERKEIPQHLCERFAEKISKVLVKRFSSLDELGKVYVDPQLKNYLVPFSQRSASKALKTITRGSQIPLDGDYDTIRFFCWWKNMDAGDEKCDSGWSRAGRVDIDLSAVILDENWNHQFDIAYYNLKEFGGCHSGDITDAPQGASEFIDISLKAILARGGRYIAMNVYNFTQHPFCNLPECFAGWMGRKDVQSGEIYDPKTVRNKIDLAADTTAAIPMIIDAKERKVIWLDMALKTRASFANCAANNSKNLGLICRAMAELKKPNLYDLLTMHAEARGRLVNSIEKADVVFDTETTPFDIDTIVTNYL